MNRLTIIGNLTRDPEMRVVHTGAGETNVCTLSVAVNRRQRAGEEQKTDFFRVTVWRAMAEACGKYLHKGSKVAVSGPVSVSTYQAKDGTTRASLEVQGEDVEFLSKANEQRGDAYDSDVTYQAPAAPKPQQMDMMSGMVVAGEEELPF